MNIKRLLVHLLVTFGLVLGCISSSWSQQHKFSKYLVDRRSDYSTWNVTASGILPTGDVVLAGEDRLIFLSSDGKWKFQKPLRMANGVRIQFANSITVADDGTFYVPAGYGLQHFSTDGNPLNFIVIQDYIQYITKGPNNRIVLLSYDKLYFIDGLTGEIVSNATISTPVTNLLTMFVNGRGNVVIISNYSTKEYDLFGNVLGDVSVRLYVSHYDANYDYMNGLQLLCSLDNGQLVGFEPQVDGFKVVRLDVNGNKISSTFINERLVTISADSKRIIVTSGKHNIYCLEIGTMRKLWMYSGLPAALGFTQDCTYNFQPGIAIKKEQLIVTGKNSGTVLSKLDGAYIGEVSDGGAMGYDIVKTPHGYLSLNGNTYSLHYVDDSGQEYIYPEMFDAITADQNGFFYAVSRTALVKFNEKLQKVIEIPLLGTDINQPTTSTMTCVANNELWILRTNTDIERYSLDGVFLSKITLEQSIRYYLGSSWCRLKYSKTGYIVLSTYPGQIVVLDPVGNVVERFYVPNLDNGFGPGIDVDDDGTIFIAGRYGIQVFPDYSQDKLPPVTEIRTTPELPIDAWFKSTTVVSLTASDVAQHIGVKEIHYTIDSGAEQIVAGDTASFTITDTGAHSVAYWAVDNAGNIEVTKYATVRIDTIAPVTTLTRANGSVTLSATDAHSGVAKTRISVNGGAAVDYTGPISDAIHTITYWSEDVAGNVEGSHTEQLNPGIQAIQASAARLVGGVGVVGTVTLDQPAPVGGTTVTLSASNTAVSIPTNIVIPEGQTTGEFDIDASPVASATSVVITASCFGTEQSTIITIDAPTPHSITLAPASITGGGTTTATLLISGIAPDGGLLVRVASSSLAMSVPTTVTVPAGQMSVVINVQTNSVSVDSNAILSATANGVKAKATLAILGPRVQTLALSSTTVVSAGQVTGTVTLNVAAPTGGKVVTLTSGNTAVATVPAAVTVPAGQTSATFTVTAGTVATSTVVSISAATNGSTTSANLTVTPPPAALTTVSLNPSAIYGAVTSTGTITLTSAAPTGGAIVTLASSNTAGATVPVNVTIPAGATSATFVITGKALTTAATTTITATYSGVSKTAILTVNPTISVSTLTLNPTSVKGGTSSVATVTLSVAAPAGGVVVTMSSATTAAATVPASVTVAAGSRTATVTITTLTQTATRTSVISARVGTTTARTATLSVTR